MVGSFVVYLNSHMAPNIFFSDNPLAWHFKYHCSSCHAWFNDAITYSYLCFVSLWPSMDLPLRLHMLEFRLHIAIVFLCSTDSLNTFTEWLNPVAHARHGWPANSSCQDVAKQEGVFLSAHCTCHCTIVLLSVFLRGPIKCINNSMKLVRKKKQYETNHSHCAPYPDQQQMWIWFNLKVWSKCEFTAVCMLQ